MNKKLILPSKELLTPDGPRVHEKVFLGMPTRNGVISCGAAQAAMVQVTANRIALFRASTHTNLELNYNMLLCDAINLCNHDGVKWFAMLHDDIHPEPFWLDTLIDEAEKYGADLMSAYVPLKDNRQVSSTALSDPNDEWIPFSRLTLKQIHHPDFPDTVDSYSAIAALRRLPEPFSITCPLDSELLINTGCMVMRVDRPWINRIHFHKKDTVIQENGVWGPMTWTEDWMLSQDLHDVGAQIMATRKVSLTHWDGQRFFSSIPDEHGQDVDESTHAARAYRHSVKELKLL
jgi:hypothetical protein